LADRTSAAAELVREVTRFVFDERGFASMALHDPLAVAVAVDSSLVTSIQRDVLVETRGEHTLGQTVVDLRPNAAAPRFPHRVCTAVDAARFKAVFMATLGLTA